MTEKEKERNTRFRELAGDISPLLPEVEVGFTTSEELGVLKAIETGEIAVYTSKIQLSNQQFDALYILLAIYDELDNEEPDEDFIEELIGQLKELLQ